MRIPQPLYDHSKIPGTVTVCTPIALNRDTHSTTIMDLFRYGILIANHVGLLKNQIIDIWSPNHQKFLLRRKQGVTS